MLFDSQSREPEPETGAGTGAETGSGPDSQTAGDGTQARLDDEMQRRIVALAGALQDRERATITLAQLEAAAEEAGLEPRFVREAARRLLLSEQPFPLAAELPASFSPRRPAAPPTEQRSSSRCAHEESLARTLAAAEREAERRRSESRDLPDAPVARGALAESNFDALPLETREFLNPAETINAGLLKTQSSEPMIAPTDLTSLARRVELSLAPELKPRQENAGTRIFLAALALVMILTSLAVYAVAFLCLFTPESETVRIVSAMTFGAIAYVLTRFTRKLWRDVWGK